MSRITKFCFGIILIIAVFFRFYQLNTLPPSLNWDEVSHGVNAESLLESGYDQWGGRFPIFNFRAYGDYPTTINLYLSLPFIKFLGLNSLSTRLPSAIFGLILVIASFFIANIFFADHRYSLLVMLLCALSPWSLFPSRAVFQSTVAQGFLSLGLLFFFLSLRRPKLLFISALTFGLSMYSYHSTRIIAPFLFITLIFINRPSLKKNWLPLILFLFLAIPSLINLLQPESRARSLWVSILSPAAINEINENRRLYSGPVMINRLLNNKVTYFIPRFIGNYLNLFNPLPLFFTGTGQYQFNIPHTGFLFSICLPFFYLGLFITILKSRQDHLYQSLLAWNMIAILPAAITSGDFPAIRAMTLLPLPFIYITLGVKKLSPKFGLIFIAILIFQFIFYWQNYTTKYFRNYSSSWQYGYQDTINLIKPLYSQYSTIYFTKKYGEPHEFILFYWPWNITQYRQDPNLKWDYHANWYWVNSFDKFIFFNDWETPTKFSPHTLLVTSPGNYPQFNAKLLKTVNFLDGSPAFDIVSYD